MSEQDADAGAPAGNASRPGVLSGKEIRDRGVIVGADESGWRSCGYDLAVGTVVNHLGKARALQGSDTFEIPAHGMIEVIARETVAMPANLIGYAMVKTRLTSHGIFALNIGIVDPGYSGGVSTTLINFGRSPFELKAGEQFLRLTFHGLVGEPVSDSQIPTVNANQYLEERKRKAKEHFSETFLDMAATAEKAAQRLLEDWQKRLLFWAPVLVFTLALVTFFFNFSQVVGTHRHSVTDVEVHNICRDVARVLQDKQSTQALSGDDIAAICLRRGAAENARPLSEPHDSGQDDHAAFKDAEKRPGAGHSKEKLK